MDCDVIKVPARVSLTVAASVAGELESKGPLGKYFDICENDIYFGQKTFEQAESELMRRTVSVLLTKSGLKAQDIDLILSGDLLNQCCATGHSLGESKYLCSGFTERAARRQNRSAWRPCLPAPEW